jgi:isocitrate/isopropylmalate dehydrogenase
VDFAWTHFDWSCEVYARTGRMMPEDGLDQLRRFAPSTWARSASPGSRITCPSGASSSRSAASSSNT